MVKDIAIVIPTIRPELMKEFEKAWEPLFDKHNVEYIVIADGYNPKVIVNGVEVSFNYLKELVQRFYTGVVNIGYAYIYKNLPDVKYIITFHDDETPVGDCIQDHIDILNKKASINWFTPTSEFMRGFPYKVREEAPIMPLIVLATVLVFVLVLWKLFPCISVLRRGG